MKKYLLNKSIAIFLLAVTFTSCDAILDQEEIDFGQGPVLAQFENSSITANFIKDGSTVSYDVPITIIGGRNEPLDVPVEVTISADASSTATAGVEYSLDNTKFTIPAGELSVNAVIKVNTSNLDPFDAKTLVLKIDSSSQGVSETNTTSVTLQAVCSLDLNNFLGSYTSTTAGVSKNSLVTLGSKPNSLLITTGSEKILVELNTDVTNPTITYVEEGAVLSVHASYGDIWATTISPALSTYNSCDFSMKLEYKRCVSIGCFAGSRITTMTKN
ncbi:DUF1735 domain-containing protein [Flavobacterium psychrolimnae]|uniref:Calx-beta domain-containing protein n=1 Tax=Flavobacterium psychrolimnae TaxID=249351 RepID=A0A366B068_9FLAO|nr:DUF1735 domain-containing protein [Flavobacterium psychrolimnae]RBN49557.1 hypothetical protein DR980_12780 [Flavobacterium psychrolimnae]